MATASSKLEQLNSKLASAFGIAAGSVGMLVGEPAGFVALCAQSVYLDVSDKVENAYDTVRAMAMDY